MGTFNVTLKGDKAYLKVFAIILLTFLFALSTMGSAFANYSDPRTIVLPQNDAGKLQEILNDPSKANFNKVEFADGSGQSGAIFSVSNGALVFDKGAFEAGTAKSQKEALKMYTTSVSESKMTTNAQRKAVSGVQDFSSTANKMMIPLVVGDMSADMNGGYHVISGGMPLGKILLGILVYLILFGLVLSTVFDFIYAGIPFARKIGAGKDGGDQKPMWVSADMYSAIKDSESGETYSNVYGKYLIRRSWTYVLLVLCIVVLVMGELGSFIALIMSLFDGFIGGN